MLNKCPICFNQRFKKSDNNYQRCLVCGYEFLSTTNKEKCFIINEKLIKDDLYKLNLLDDYKNKILRKITQNNLFLLDIGSASGRFLFQNKKLFKDYAGLEVTKECLDFSNSILPEKIFTQINEIKANKISVVTYWQTLEHVSLDVIKEMLVKIENLGTNDLRILISVPNSDSLAYKLFKSDYAYYDSSSHLHQFSRKSLTKLMNDYGFKEKRYFFSFIYSFFGYMQTILNKFNSHRNFYYYYVKRGWFFNEGVHNVKLIYFYNLFIGIIIAPIVLLLTFTDAIFKNYSCVLNICYTKR